MGPWNCIDQPCHVLFLETEMQQRITLHLLVKVKTELWQADSVPSGELQSPFALLLKHALWNLRNRYCIGNGRLYTLNSTASCIHEDTAPLRCASLSGLYGLVTLSPAGHLWWILKEVCRCYFDGYLLLLRKIDTFTHFSSSEPLV